MDIDTEIPIVLYDGYETNSQVMGFHVYKEIWHPSINDILIARPQPKKPERSICGSCYE